MDIALRTAAGRGIACRVPNSEARSEGRRRQIDNLVVWLVVAAHCGPLRLVSAMAKPARGRRRRRAAALRTIEAAFLAYFRRGERVVR